MPSTDTVPLVCGQCRRTGTRGFLVFPEHSTTFMPGGETVPEQVVCANQVACWKRRPPADPTFEMLERDA